MELGTGVRGKEKLLVFVEDMLISDVELSCRRAHDVFKCSFEVIGEICTDVRAEGWTIGLLATLLDGVLIGAIGGK